VITVAKKRRFYNSIFVQAAVIVAGFALVSLLLTIYLYRQNMRMVALKETENKAIIFLSAMESSARRFVMERESKSLTELVEEKAEYLEKNLNFKIIRIMVRDAEGIILDHTRKDKIGERYITDDFNTVMSTGHPLITRQIKTLKLETDQPEIPVIEVLFPISSRNKDEMLAVVKITLDVGGTFEAVQQAYTTFRKRIVLGLALAAVLLVLGTLYFLRRQILLPVLSVAEGSARVTSGDLQTRLVPRGSNEISDLIGSFNRMVEGLQQRDQLRHSLEVAMQVQQNLLPGVDPAFGGLDIAGKSIYCDETGGDFYDYIEYPEKDDRIGLAIGDVSGHGISSALLMASARAFLRQRLALPGEISQAITDVNHQFSRDVAESGSFMSLFYLEIDRTDRCLNWVRCGHDPALLYDPADGSIVELKGSGIALGVDEGYHFEQYRREEITPSQIVVLGTDGIWEARNEIGEMFGKDALSRLIKENSRQSASEILFSIVNALEKFRGSGPLEDDVTVIVAKVQENF
jgi:serine phosphatase RsbU (regulator of sigma subunit)